VGKPHIQNKNNSAYSKKATALASKRVTHVAGWTSEVLSQWFTFPSQTTIYVYRLADAHQICTLNFCKWLYIFFFTGLAALYRHWRFLVPCSNPAQSKQLNHSNHISLVRAVSTHWCGNNATNRDTTDYRCKKIQPLLSKCRKRNRIHSNFRQKQFMRDAPATPQNNSATLRQLNQEWVLWPFKQASPQNGWNHLPVQETQMTILVY
jgi:hypothetical protein